MERDDRADQVGMPVESDCVLRRRQPAMRKGVDYLPMAKPVVQLTTRGSAATERFCLKRCRSLVVLCEDRDLCPSDGESWFEACEIEEQGWPS